ncbi:MAG TPA: BON domain-containing protein [Burkholderiales bacterium]|nr:BON domain-containing protein [Burkholderiales bacterium]
MRGALIAAAIACAAMLAPGRAAAEGPDPASDATIGAAVEQVLWNERSLAGADIHVESLEGQVTLRGFAATMADIATAGRLALKVPGVRGVTNTIRVALRPSQG